MIYIDSSVALAHVLVEPRAPPESFWEASLVSSRLLEYELWNRAYAYGIAGSHADEIEMLLLRVDLIEMTREVLARALEPFPVSIRTLDALHLATAEFLRTQGRYVEVASYDNRLIAAAEALGITLAAV